MSYSVIIPAAGSGSRMGADVPKVLLPVLKAKKSIIQLTLSVFCDDKRCQDIVVCYPEGWIDAFSETIKGLTKVSMIPGGLTRQESVAKGVAYLVHQKHLALDSPVLVHDAARCCLTEKIVQNVLDGITEFGAVTAAVPVVDSLCRSENHERVSCYIERESAYAVQTPQGFCLRDLHEAHRRAKEHGISGLDDASLVADLRSVHLVPGARTNIKITTPDDLRFLDFLCENGIEHDG